MLNIHKLIFQIVSLFFLVFFSMQTIAYHPRIDVYGTNDIIQKKIIQQFASDIEQYAKPIDFEQDSFEKKMQLKKKIIDGIHEIGDFAYIDISCIQYSDLTDLFTTVDLVEKKDKKRMAYLSYFSPQIKKEAQIDESINALIRAWFSYEQKRDKLFNNLPYIPNKKCPAYHCLPGGFDDLSLKEYEDKFAIEAPKNKDKLILILKNDSNEYKRGAAAFLLAHIKDGQELINILTPSIFDSSKYVRNNVMRVLGSAICIVKPSNFNIEPIIMALDFPATTDRNKALYILDSLTDQRCYANNISQFAGAALIPSLKMIQPNLHLYSYKILIKISGKFYGDRDYALWQKWFDHEKNISLGLFNYQ